MVRDILASITRSFPRIRGRNRLCHMFCEQMIKRGEDTGIVEITMRDGSAMRLNLASRTEQSVFWTGEYEPGVLSRLATCLEQGSVVLDVGANVGFYTVPLARALKKMKGKVYSFDPIPGNCDRLRELISLNGLDDDVTLVPIALGEAEGEVVLWLEGSDRSDTGNAVAVLGEVGGDVQGNTVARIRRLDDVAAELGINACRLIKIDIEGAELMALRGGIEFVRKCRPIIYAECNAYWMSKFGHSFMDVLELLSPLNYQCYRQTVAVTFERIETPVPGIEDVLFVPVETTPEIRKGLGLIESGTALSGPQVSRYR